MKKAHIAINCFVLASPQPYRTGLAQNYRFAVKRRGAFSTEL